NTPEPALDSNRISRPEGPTQHLPVATATGLFPASPPPLSPVSLPAQRLGERDREVGAWSPLLRVVLVCSRSRRWIERDGQ
ncbi:MAG: hypothetical protein ACK44Z_15185, partial [Pirellulaceae bacterium]